MSESGKQHANVASSPPPTGSAPSPVEAKITEIAKSLAVVSSKVGQLASSRAAPDPDKDKKVYSNLNIKRNPDGTPVEFQKDKMQ